MTDPRDIMPAIDLLMHTKTKKVLPRWFVYLDFALATLYLTAYAAVLTFIVYKLLSWL